MSEITSYIILISVLLVGSLIIAGLVYWYVYIRCGNDTDVGGLCFKDCDCKNGKKCGYSNASAEAVSVCCPQNTVTVNGKVYCDSLPNGTVCLNSSMCASANCVNNLCVSGTAGDNPSPNPTPSQNPSQNPSPNPSPNPTPNPTSNPNTNNNLPYGSNCVTTDQCQTGLICQPITYSSSNASVCCQLITGPTGVACV